MNRVENLLEDLRLFSLHLARVFVASLPTPTTSRWNSATEARCPTRKKIGSKKIGSPISPQKDRVRKIGSRLTLRQFQTKKMYERKTTSFAAFAPSSSDEVLGQVVI